MESLRENKLLMYAILTSSAVVVLLTTGLSADLNNTFEIIEFPDDVRRPLTKCIVFLFVVFVSVSKNPDLRSVGRYNFGLFGGPSVFVPVRFDTAKIGLG